MTSDVLPAIRRRVIGWSLRLYLRVNRRVRGKRDGSGLLSLLPDSALVPLQRTGLDPVAELRDVRERAPVSRLALPFGLRGWLVTGYEECKAVLGATASFSNDFTNLVGTAGIAADQNPGGLGFSDPPAHTRLRRMLTPEFTGRRLRRLVPRIEQIVAGQLDEMAATADREGTVDLLQAFALPVPSLTICELLGVPYEDRAEFQRLSTARFDFLGGAESSLGAISESLGYLQRVVAKERADPGQGLLGMLVREHGEDISDFELAGLADGLLTGGLETTASMLALGALVLLQSPDSLAAVRDDPDAIDGFVEELLRYLTVVQVAFPRFARAGVTAGGQRISAGDIVLCSLSGANRDSRQGSEMDSFEPTGARPSHLAFGYGVHRCIGAELARMELRAAYPALVRRFPGIALAVPADAVPYRKLSFVFGVDSLPVTLR